MSNQDNPYASTEAAALNEKPQGTQEGRISEKGLTYLEESGKWANFLAVICFISAGFILLGSVFALIGGIAALSQVGSGLPAYQGAVILGAAGAYVVMGLIMMLPGRFLWGFQKHFKSFQETGDERQLEESLGQQKSLFKFYGIFTIMLLALFPLTVILTTITIIFNSL